MLIKARTKGSRPNWVGEKAWGELFELLSPKVYRKIISK